LLSPEGIINGSATQAVETDGPWKPWKNPTSIFPLFPPSLENSPQKALRVFHISHSFDCWLNIIKKN
jgi:hypothetical protein